MREILLLSIVMFSFGIFSANAQNMPEKIDFHRAVNMAWAVDPVRTELQVGHHSAKARSSAAGSWFAGGPTLSGEYMDDHAIGSNEGYTTYQGGVSVPLWLPGQGSATRQVASAEAASLDEQLNVEYLSLSIRILDGAAKAQIAQERLKAAHQLYEYASRINSLIAHSAHVGESSSSESQIAQSEMENARNEQALAQEYLENSQAELEVLFAQPVEVDLSHGADMAHVRFVEPRDMEDNDPRVKAAHKNVQAAQANMKLARRSFMPNPELGIDVIHEKQYGSPWDDRVGVNFSIPLPSEARNTPIMSEASNRLASANSQEIQARRMVHLEISRVRARLMAATAARQTTRIAAANMQKRAAAEEHAWRVGEATLETVMQAEQAACNAQFANARAEVEWHVATLRMMIAMGITP